MGEAKQRGSQEERVQAAQVAGAIDEAEILIAMHEDENGVLQAQFMPRDEKPNQESVAMIVAAFIEANWLGICAQAREVYWRHVDEANGLRPGQVSLPKPRQILDAQGNLARDREDAPKIIVPGGAA